MDKLICVIIFSILMIITFNWNFFHLLIILQEYVPQRDELVSKLTWDVEPVKLVSEVEPGIASAS